MPDPKEKRNTDFFRIMLANMVTSGWAVIRAAPGHYMEVSIYERQDAKHHQSAVPPYSLRRPFSW